jgi:hypothetical protein
MAWGRARQKPPGGFRLNVASPMLVVTAREKRPDNSPWHRVLCGRRFHPPRLPQGRRAFVRATMRRRAANGDCRVSLFWLRCRSARPLRAYEPGFCSQSGRPEARRVTHRVLRDRPVPWIWGRFAALNLGWRRQDRERAPRISKRAGLRPVAVVVPGCDALASMQ